MCVGDEGLGTLSSARPAKKPRGSLLKEIIIFYLPCCDGRLRFKFTIVKETKEREAVARHHHRRFFFSFLYFFQKCAKKGVSGKVRTPTMPVFSPAHPCLLEAPGPLETKRAGSERQQAPSVKGVDGNPIIICRWEQAARFIGYRD